MLSIEESMAKESKPTLCKIIFSCLFLLIAGLPALFGQEMKTEKHTITSEFLKENREVWVSLPKDYNKKGEYPVMYVLDAEYHFELVSAIVSNLSKTKKTPWHIVVGVPHVSIKKERVRDFTYSLSLVNPYGDKVLPPFFNEQNCGGAVTFSMYLNNELVPYIDSIYASNNKNVLIAHSLSGYFATGLIVREHPFYAVQLYDPSNWYANGEGGTIIKNGRIHPVLKVLYLAHQQNPGFFYAKLKELDSILEKSNIPNYKRECFEEENHRSLYLTAFLSGMEYLYKDYKQEHFKVKKERPYKKTGS